MKNLNNRTSKWKRTLAAIIACGLLPAAMLAGCGNAQEFPTKSEVTQESVDPVGAGFQLQEEEKADPLSFSNANAQIALEILKARMRQENPENTKNMLFSPLSLYEALAMTANGMDGKTLEETEAFLKAALALFNTNIHDYNASLPETLQIANSIWVNQRVGAVNDEFAKQVSDFYGAEIRSLEYDDAAVEQINGWVEEKTNGMIPEILDFLDPEQAMVLINALSFEAQWMEPYEAYQVKEDGTFTNSAGEEEDAVMLTSKENHYITYVDPQTGEILAEGFVKLYEDGKTAFCALLPKESTSSADLLDALTGEGFLECYQNKTDSEDVVVYAEIPEFTFDDSMKLVPYMEEAGMECAFDPSRAEFPYMFAEPTDTFIGDIIQKTHIELDRNGTKAAAATAVMTEGCSLDITPPETHEIILDRPFFYAIVDYETGMPLFTGITNTLAE